MYSNSNHTLEGGDTQWVKLELDKPYKIRKIIIYNRPDCCQNRLKGAKLRLFGNTYADGEQKHEFTLTAARKQEFLIEIERTLVGPSEINTINDKSSITHSNGPLDRIIVDEGNNKYTNFGASGQKLPVYITYDVKFPRKITKFVIKYKQKIWFQMIHSQKQ